MDDKKCDTTNKTLLRPSELDSESEPGENYIIKTEGDAPKRGQWNSRVEFLLSCIGMAVGLGNIWRFPYLCFKNGGGAFLIPFLISMVFIGLPLFFMELALGQFASVGTIGVWNISPMFKGIGYGMTIVSCIVGIYYNIVIAQCFYYFGVSFTSSLPWSHCNNSWNNKTLCYDGSDNSTSMRGKLSPSEEYYDNYVTNKSQGIEDMGLPQWKLVICLAVAWVIVIVILIKGVKYIGKASYFTAIFPYLILTILLIRGILLPGSLQGIIYYIKPDFQYLRYPRVWVEAATQVFFSLGVCNGNLMTMSSYNDFKNDCCRDAIIFAVIDCLTSVYAGFVIFSNMGFMSQALNVSITEVVAGGPGLAFKVYPQALSKMPLSPLWSVFFFLMMITLGFGSQLAIVETILSSFQDELRRKKIMSSKSRVIIYRVIVCLILFLIGIPMTCRGGMYLLDLFDASVGGYTMLVLGLVETLVVSYVYGINRFIKDVDLMIGRRPNLFWKICWMAITPIYVIVLIISLFVFSHNEPALYPKGFMALQHILSFSPIGVLIIIFAVFYCKNGGWLVLTEIRKPLYNWGPADDPNKQSFINSLSQIDGDSKGVSKFFQSKESIAEKFNKRANQGSEDIRNSTILNRKDEIEILADNYCKLQPKAS